MLEIKSKDVLNYEACVDNYNGNCCLLTLTLKRRSGLKDSIINYATKDKFIQIKYGKFILSGTVIYLHTSFYNNDTDVLPVISLSLENIKIDNE